MGLVFTLHIFYVSCSLDFSKPELESKSRLHIQEISGSYCIDIDIDIFLIHKCSIHMRKSEQYTSFKMVWFSAKKLIS